MSNFITSMIRTYVPILVGAVLSYLMVNHGIVVPEDLKNEATAFLTGVVIAVYYGVVHWLEQKWPAFGKLLGRQVLPYYQPNN